MEAQRQAADAFLASKNAADSTPMGQALKQLRHFVSDRSPDSVAELADYMSRAGVPTQAFSGKRRHLPFQRKIYGWLVSEGGMDVDGVTRGFTAILSTDGRLWADRDGYLEIRRWTDGPSADEAYEFFRNRNRGY